GSSPARLSSTQGFPAASWAPSGCSRSSPSWRVRPVSRERSPLLGRLRGIGLLDRPRRAVFPLAAALALAVVPLAAGVPVPDRAHSALVRILGFGYRAHNGVERLAFLVLPRWYGPQRHPPIPLVISPHGRGVDA